jgi:arsenite/tail-anchored protein-transporting ATPase
MESPVHLFFMGKGGVGKSTSAALTAIFLARRGHRILLASLDPAHNQSDILERDLSNKPSRILHGLHAMEIDREIWIRAYLREMHVQIRKTYSYLTAFNLEKYFGVIRHSPGLEEYALALAFEKIRTDRSRFDYLIFDMPPTALSLKFFRLPSLSLAWIDQLRALRGEIVEKRELIARIKLPGREFERDKVLGKIEEQRGRYQALKTIFEDAARTRLILVLNPDKLSRAESLRIIQALGDIGIAPFCAICNKRPANGSVAAPEPISDIPARSLPHSDTPLVGIENLRRFAERNADVLEQTIMRNPEPSPARNRAGTQPAAD